MLEIELGMYALNSMNVDCWFSFHYLYATGQRIISHLETSLTFFFFPFLSPVQKEGGSVREKVQESAEAKILRGSPQPLPKRDSCW